MHIHPVLDQKDNPLAASIGDKSIGTGQDVVDAEVFTKLFEHPSIETWGTISLEQAWSPPYLDKMVDCFGDLLGPFIPELGYPYTAGDYVHTDEVVPPIVDHDVT